jgi:septal ring-binding cell division protein DamX
MEIEYRRIGYEIHYRRADCDSDKNWQWMLYRDYPSIEEAKKALAELRH